MAYLLFTILRDFHPHDDDDHDDDSGDDDAAANRDHRLLSVSPFIRPIDQRSLARGAGRKQPREGAGRLIINNDDVVSKRKPN